MSDVKRQRSVKRFSIDCSKGGRTMQHFGPICDVNSIVEKARKSGLVTHLTSKKPIFRDVSNIPDYRAALDIVNSANESFSGLSSRVRERFSNDPEKMVLFLRDPSNYDEAVKLGLVVKAEPKGDAAIGGASGTSVVPKPVKAVGSDKSPKET